MSAVTATRPLPRVGYDHAGFWEGAREGELRIRACRSCGQFLHLPREFCRHCGGRDLEWRTVSGEAHLYSWSVVHHQVHPAFPTPYTLFLVELDDAPGVRLLANAPGEVEVRAGMPMELWFETLAEGVVIPQFRPSDRRD